MSKVMLLVLVLIGLLFLLVRILTYHKQLNQKDKQILMLNKKLDELEERINRKERRKSFRLKVENKKCEFNILKVGSREIDLVKGRIGVGQVIDISFTGLRFESPYNLPVKDEVEIEISFELDNNTFEFKGLLIRKEEHINNNNFSYGLKYIETDFKSEEQYNKLLRAKEFEKRNGPYNWNS